MIERILNRFGYFKRTMAERYKDAFDAALAKEDTIGFDKTGWKMWPIIYGWAIEDDWVIPPQNDPIEIMRDGWTEPVTLGGSSYIHPAANVYGLWWRLAPKKDGSV